MRIVANVKLLPVQIYDGPTRGWLGFGAAQLVTSKKVNAPPIYPDQIIRFQFMSMAAK